MNAVEWLGQEAIVRKTDGCRYKTKVIERLAELMVVNGGGLTVTAWGKVQRHTDAIYGRVGLEMSEALELINLGGILHGFMMCQGEELVNSKETYRQRVLGMLARECDRVKQEGFDVTAGKVDEPSKKVVEIYGEKDMEKLGRDKDMVIDQLRSGRGRGRKHG